MTDRALRHIATVHCKPYKCEAFAYVWDNHPSGGRVLVVQYGDRYSGPTDLPIADNGRREFKAGLPDGMTDQQITDQYLWDDKGHAGISQTPDKSGLQ
jgi:hypothetical protein